MSGDKIDIEAFLDELVSALEKRLKRHEAEIERLERELASVKKKMKGHARVDRSVLRVLGGK